MKVQHKYDDDLETMLMFLSDDEFLSWLQTNEILYKNPNLLEVMLESQRLDEEKNV